MNAKRIVSTGLAFAMAATLFVGCGSSDTSADSSSQDASADTANTDEASTDTSSEDASSTDSTASSDVSGTVATNGSTSMKDVIGALSEQFMADNPNVQVTYDGTGSGSGIEAVSNGTADIGLASRDLKDEESSKGLKQTTIALDGIAIIVNADNKVKDLSLDQIKKIYTGEITNWKDVGGDDAAISPIGREAGSGTRDGFESVTDTKDACKYESEQTSTGGVIQTVQSNANAIGYASFSAVEGQDGITSLTVEGVECNEANIADGSYKVQRDFNLITVDGTDLSPAAQAFFDYATSKDASELITKAGAVPTAK